MTSDELVLVAGPESYFPDDIPCACTTCGARLYRRPHAPATARVVCLRCVGQDLRGKPLEVMVTAATIAEVRSALAAMASPEVRRQLLAGSN